MDAGPSSLPTALSAARKTRTTAASASARRNEGKARKKLAAMTKENARLRAIVTKLQEEKRRVVASHKSLVSAVSRSARSNVHKLRAPAASAAVRPAFAPLDRTAGAGAAATMDNSASGVGLGLRAAVANDRGATPLGSSPTELRRWMDSSEGSPSTVALNLLSGFGAPPSPPTLEAPRGYSANPHVSPTRFSPRSIPLPLLPLAGPSEDPSASPPGRASAQAAASHAPSGVRVNRHGSVSISMP